MALFFVNTLRLCIILFKNVGRLNPRAKAGWNSRTWNHTHEILKSFTPHRRIPCFILASLSFSSLIISRHSRNPTTDTMLNQNIQLCLCLTVAYFLFFSATATDTQSKIFFFFISTYILQFQLFQFLLVIHMDSSF